MNGLLLGIRRLTLFNRGLNLCLQRCWNSHLAGLKTAAVKEREITISS
jgi:hypothetical protein